MNKDELREQKIRSEIDRVQRSIDNRFKNIVKNVTGCTDADVKDLKFTLEGMDDVFEKMGFGK